jgi:Holliday junction resolvase RusA-like endonuclease
LIIIIPGKPIAKARPRFVRRGKFVATYSAQETEEGKWITIAMDQISQVLEGPIFLECWFTMPIPKSATKKKRSAMQAREIKHVKKPDLDNLVKFCKDCLNELAWRDDSQVVRLVAEKYYGVDPCTRIRITAA